MPTVALDAAGADAPPPEFARVAAHGAAQALGQAPDLRVILVGDRRNLEAALEGVRIDHSRVRVEHATTVITMEDNASDAIRSRNDSSVVRAVALVASGEADAAVSMGHSGATLAAGLFRLGRVSGVERPAILATVPTLRGRVAFLDVGANAVCRPTWLRDFAVLGQAFAETLYPDQKPTVGLLSLGSEAHKGSDLVLDASRLIAETPGINFHGHVEGHDLLKGTTSVVVTDGFTGNVLLKGSEGAAGAVLQWIRRAFSGSLPARLAGLAARPVLLRVRRLLDPEEFGAMPLVGLNGLLFIGHGSSGPRAVRSGLLGAAQAVETGLLDTVRSRFAGLREAGALRSSS